MLTKAAQGLFPAWNRRSTRGSIGLRRSGIPVPFHRPLDSRTSSGEVLRIHGRADRKSGVEGEEPWFGNCGQLRRLLHVKEYVARALTIIFGEVRGFRFQLLEDPLNCRS